MTSVYVNIKIPYETDLKLSIKFCVVEVVEILFSQFYGKSGVIKMR